MRGTCVCYLASMHAPYADDLPCLFPCPDSTLPPRLCRAKRGSMMQLRLLGAVELCSGDGQNQQSVAVQPKRAAVLAYLAAARPGPLHRRDTLLSLFWPESSDEHARNALSKTLHYLRERVGPDAVVRHGDGEVGLSPEIVWCDVTAFEDAADRGDLEEAASLYAGHFMEGFHVDAAPEFEHWLDAHRKRLRLRACEVAWALSDAAEASGDRGVAERWGRTAVSWAPEDEGGIRRLLLLLQLHGNRGSAIQAYDAFAVRLRDDYGVEPSDPTLELIAAIREGSIESAPMEVDAHPASAASEVMPPPIASPDADRRAGAIEQPLGERRGDGSTRRLPRNARRPLAGVAAMAVAWIGFSALGDTVGEPVSSAAPGAGSSVLVLPFQNLSEDAVPARVPDFLAEQLIGYLVGIEPLRVVNQTELAPLKDAGRTSRDIGASFNVETVLEGSISQAGAQLRVSATLTDLETNEVLWSGQYDGERAGPLAGKAALEIAAALETTFSPSESRLETRTAAFDVLQRAMEVVQGRNESAERQTIALLHQAIVLDPTFAEAVGSLGWLYGDLYWRTGEQQWADSAEAFARRAIALDGTLSRGHHALARSFMARGQFSEARLTFLAGMDATDELGGLGLDLSAVSVEMGLLDEGLLWAERVLADSPSGGSANGLYHVGYPLLALGDDARTQQFLDESLERLPDLREDPVVARLLGLYAHLDLSRGRFAEAMLRYRDRASAYPAHEGILGELAWAAYVTGDDDARVLMERHFAGAELDGLPAYGFLLAQAGQEERGNEILDEAWRSVSKEYDDGSEDPAVPRDLGMISAARGETEEAFVWLDRAYQAGLRDPAPLQLDPMFDSVRDDPRFVRLLETIEADREDMRRRAFNREGSMFRDPVSER
jgi:DNA-binding SARP family transcriptional activator/TolB-like protein